MKVRRGALPRAVPRVLGPAPGPRVVAAMGLAWAALAIVATLNDLGTLTGAFRRMADVAALPDRFSLAGLAGRLLTLPLTGFAAAGWMAAAFGLGRSATRLAGRRWSPALTATAGAGLGSMTAMGLAAAGLAFPPLLIGAVALPALAGLVGAVRDRRRRPPIAVPLPDPWLLATLAVGLATWITVAAIPDTLEDPLTYHWAAPEHYLRHHRLLAAPEHMQFQNPLVVEMTYLLALALGGIGAIKSLALALGLLGAALTAGLARRLVPGGTGWIAATVLVLTPAMTEQVWLAKNDPGTFLFWVAAVSASLAPGLRTRAGAAACGLFAGLCAGSKYTSVFPLVGLTAWVLGLKPRRERLALVAAVGAAAVLPWFLRNWFDTGNPAFPLAYRVFGGLWWDVGLEDAVHGYARAVTPPDVMKPSYAWYVLRDVLASPATVGAALAALGPLGLALLLPAPARLATGAAAAAFLLLLTERNGRFLIPLLALAACGAEATVVALKAAVPPAPRRAVLGVLLGLGLLGSAGHVALWIPDADALWLAGQATAAEARARRYTMYEECRTWTAAHLPANARLLFEGEHRRFGFRQPVMSTHIVEQPPVWRWATQAADAPHLARKWRQAGIRYLVYNLVQSRFRHTVWFQGPAWPARALQVYRAFAVHCLTEVHQSPHMDYLNGMLYVMRVDWHPHPATGYVAVLPWTETLILPAGNASRRGDKDEARTLALGVLKALPDVGEIADEVAGTLHEGGAIPQALVLHRWLAENRYHGETNWYYLAVEESMSMKSSRSFAALREQTMYTGEASSNLPEALASSFVNWGIEAAHAGRMAAACTRVGIGLRIMPGYAQARKVAAMMGCVPATPPLKRAAPARNGIFPPAP